MRKNSMSEIPELKKPKLEIPLVGKDVDMLSVEGEGGITPGASVEDSFESPVDAEIPVSPTFTGKAKEIPHFDISDDDAVQVKHTQLEHDNDENDDELDRSAVPREPAPQVAPDVVPNSLHEHQHCHVPNSVQDQHLIRNSNAASNFPNSGGHQGVKQQGAGIAAWAFGEPKPPTEQRVPYVASNPATDVMPPWLLEIREFWQLAFQSRQATPRYLGFWG